MSDLDVGDLLRLVVFIIAVLLLASGLYDLASVGGTDLSAAFSSGSTGLIKLFISVILFVLAINPDAVFVSIGWHRQD